MTDGTSKARHQSGRARVRVRRLSIFVLTGMITAITVIVGASTSPAGADPAPAFVQLAVGGVTSCGVTGDGAAYCWGSDLAGQLGNGPTITGSQPLPSPVDAPAGVRWASLSTSSFAADNVAFTCGVTTEGAGYCWGSDTSGKLGNGSVLTESQVSPSPVATPSGVTWDLISVGSHHACGLTTGRAIYCWGGIQGAFTDVPELLAGGPWTALSSGSNYACAVSQAGGAFCWGNENFGQFGDGLPILEGSSSPTPVTTPAGVTWADIEGGSFSTCGLTTAGAAYCWGSDALGALGNGPATTDTQPTPALVDTPAGLVWSQLSVSGSGGCGVTTTGAIYCWGTNQFGLLAADTDTVGPAESPVEIASPSGAAWSTFSRGESSVCATTVDGSSYCWGLNDEGQLGIGVIGGQAETPQLVPVPASGPDFDGDGVDDATDPDDDNDAVLDGDDAFPLDAAEW
jgi:alpha-tubulin suppressor-like RCC1 family protein